MKKNILIGTLLCGMVLGSVVAPNIALAAENLREESTKKRKLTLHYTTDFGDLKSVQITATTGQLLDLKKVLPKGYDLAIDQEEKIMITEKTDTVTIKLAAQTRYDMIQFMGAKGVSMRSILKHTGEMITIKDYEKFVPKGYVVDTNRQTTFVSGNDRWGQTFYVYLKPAPAVTHVEKEIKFVSEDGISFQGFSAVFNINGQLVIDPDKIPEGYEIEPRYITVLDNGEKTIEIKLFKLFNNTVQFVTPDGEIVSTTEIKGRADSKVSVQAPEGYEYPDESFKLFTILSEKTTQKVIVTPLIDASVNTDVPEIVPDINVETPETGNASEDSDSEDNLEQVVEQPDEDSSIGQEVVPAPTPDSEVENPEMPSNNQEIDPPTEIDETEIEETDEDTSDSTNDIVDPQKVEAVKGQVMTHHHQKVQLFDQTGRKLDLALEANTDWLVDQKMTHNGETYYRVATDCWVKASDVLEYERAEQVVNTGDKMRLLYDSKGKHSSHRSLAENSEWFVDKSTTIDGKKYYRVSTNEWILADDIK
ncbi:SLAP domain-containing protein [Companilactobacillus furfuricola]|uniref:SLAP domain-containing protein n=1 Tax=Companilactobacillus furfuricola TaxID=1462575 RepID=UPI000F76C42F|nr:SLAP domain-containing protein [Companilactobacillus furfuricola]